MKIIVLTNNYPRKDSLNNGIFIHRQVKALQQLGVTCYVLLLHNWYPPLGLHKYHPYWREGHRMRRGFFEAYEGVKVFSVPVFVRVPSRLFRESYYERAVRAIIRQIKCTPDLRNADWLYAHFLTDNGYIGTKVKEALHIKLAAIARGDDIHAWPEEIPALRTHLSEVFKKADVVLANSQSLGRDAHRWMQPGNERKIEVVYNGIEYGDYRPAENDEERASIRSQFQLQPSTRYLLCVAPPIAAKGWLDLLEAVKNADKQFDGWQLLTVAPKITNKDAIDLEKIIDELQISDRVRHVGALVPHDLARLVRACDAFVLPSHNEGMANALLEAMASGLACIATEVGGHREVMEDAVDGLLVKPRDVEALTRAIRTIAGDSELRMSLGKNARKRMIAFGNYLQNAKKLLQILLGNKIG